MDEADMDVLHDDNDYHEEDEMEDDDLDFDDAVLWGDQERDAAVAEAEEQMEDSDDEDEEQAPQALPQDRDEPIPAGDARQLHVWNLRGQLGGALPEFVRMLLPVEATAVQRERRTNEDLVRCLRRHSNITCKDVIKAFQVCPRDIFVPEDQRGEAFEDNPLRLDRDFNISAPHMHACMIQGLKIQPGDHVLDIGSGCGATTAMMAFLAGRQGKVVGIELRAYALELSRNALAKMQAKKEYVARACDVQFEQGNAFILPEHEGKYDKVHVGGQCEMSKLPVLLKLLKPGTGRLVVPCDSELLCLTRTPDKIEREVLANVLFGELETPTDVEIVFGHLEQHREWLMTPEEAASHYEEEMAQAIGRPVPPPRAAAGSVAVDDGEELDVHSTCTCGSFGIASTRAGSLMGRPSLSSAGSPPTPCIPFPRHFSPASPCAVPAPVHAASGASPFAVGSVPSGSPPDASTLASALGPPDCTVRGSGFTLHAHSSVLQARCPVMHAQFRSGMRDADANEVTLPPHFCEAAVHAALDYMYTDRVALDEDSALPTLAVAVYLNMSHLVVLVSQFIVSHLREQDVQSAVESAAQLHVFASEHGLDSLCRFCAAFLAVHIAEARGAPSYKSLGAKELDEVLEAVASERELVVSRLESLSCGLADLGAEFANKH